MFLPSSFDLYMALSASFIISSRIPLTVPLAREAFRDVTPMELVISPFILRALSPPGYLFLMKTNSSMVFLSSSAYCKPASSE